MKRGSRAHVGSAFGHKAAGLRGLGQRGPRNPVPSYRYWSCKFPMSHYIVLSMYGVLAEVRNGSHTFTPR